MGASGLLVTGASFAAFRGMHWGLRRLPVPGATAQDRWKWRNIAVSLVHSLITGFGALLGLVLYPQLATDPIHTHPPWTLLLVAVSVGYFLADGLDMLKNQTWGQAWELLCHHLAVVSCLGTAVLFDHYVGFSLVSLLLELNSACLHLRKLLLLSHQAPSVAFSLASWATLATLVLFRLAPLVWMSLWLIWHYRLVPPALLVLGGTGLATVGALSIKQGVLIFISDVLRSQSHSSSRGHREARVARTYDGEPAPKEDSPLGLKD
ncbi:TLC domain-containing protein 2 [Pipistrellus kuhlii]|uniref:TLC domain containing 2 n=1 Tax=Pipistrellus kuhlii TaxID=59472 RepID=A0A7J7SN41_PIPKU|nr:TLC domain-containing protein 2 [Pipistrellus kuhlii]KAF6289770.1 TLC domain containing 2 [Pipistrellus kuhlii]